MDENDARQYIQQKEPGIRQRLDIADAGALRRTRRVHGHGQHSRRGGGDSLRRRGRGFLDGDKRDNRHDERVLRKYTRHKIQIPRRKRRMDGRRVRLYGARTGIQAHGKNFLRSVGHSLVWHRQYDPGERRRALALGLIRAESRDNGIDSRRRRSR